MSAINKLKPTSLNVSLGTIETAQRRRSCYQAMADKLGVTLSKWVKDTLDKASGYQHE